MVILIRLWLMFLSYIFWYFYVFKLRVKNSIQFTSVCVSLKVAKDFSNVENAHPIDIRVNLDSRLMLLLREMTYLSSEQFTVPQSSTAYELVAVTQAAMLGTMSKRLETIVSMYNGVMKGVTLYELALFDRTLSKIWQVSSGLFICSAFNMSYINLYSNV